MYVLSFLLFLKKIVSDAKIEFLSKANSSVFSIFVQKDLLYVREEPILSFKFLILYFSLTSTSLST